MSEFNPRHLHDYVGPYVVLSTVDQQLQNDMTHCGVEVSEEYRYCPHCGDKLIRSSWFKFPRPIDVDTLTNYSFQIIRLDDDYEKIVITPNQDLGSYHSTPSTKRTVVLSKLDSDVIDTQIKQFKKDFNELRKALVEKGCTVIRYEFGAIVECYENNIGGL